MRKLITILLFFVSLNVTAAEIFRLNMGVWEYNDGVSGWLVLPKYDDPNDAGLADGIGDLETDGEVVEWRWFTNTGATNNGRPINVTGDNVIITKCIVSTSHGIGIYSLGNINLLVDSCLFYDLPWAILAQNMTANFKILRSQFLNLSWDRNAPLVGCCNGQSVFLNNVQGSGNEIAYNHIENNVGESNNEDHINTFLSGGTSGSHFGIHHNIIRGGGGGSMTSGGIIGGDNGTVYLDIYENKLEDPGWYAIQIYSGHNISVTENDAYSPTSLPWNSVAFFIKNGSGTGDCTNMTMNTTNKAYYRRAASLGGGLYPFEYDGVTNGGCTGGPFDADEDLSLTPAGMGIPDHLINFVDSNTYWQMRDTRFREAIIVAAVEDFTPNANVRRPVADAGADQPSVTATSATLTSSSDIAVGGTGTFSLTGHSWTQVSGPNTSTIVSPTSSSTSITGLITGTYVYRYVVEQNNTQYSLKTYDPDWITVTVATTSIRKKGRMFF